MQSKKHSTYSDIILGICTTTPSDTDASELLSFLLCVCVCVYFLM